MVCSSWFRPDVGTASRRIWYTCKMPVLRRMRIVDIVGASSHVAQSQEDVDLPLAKFPLLGLGGRRNSLQTMPCKCRVRVYPNANRRTVRRRFTPESKPPET